MNQEKKQNLALMKYSAIAPLITGLSDDYTSLSAFYRDASAKGVLHPDGTIRHYAPATIEILYRCPHKFFPNGKSLLPCVPHASPKG